MRLWLYAGRLAQPFIASAIVAVLLPFVAQSQTTFGSVSGLVSDATGAPVPAVPVTLTNLTTGEKRVTATDEAGLYQFVNLIPGSYKIDVEKPGFRHFTRQTATVEVQQAVRIDIGMEVGEVSQLVNVTSETPLLQEQTLISGTGGRTETGQRCSAERAQRIQLNGSRAVGDTARSIHAKPNRQQSLCVE